MSELVPAELPQPLDAALTTPAVDFASWPFETTADLEPLESIVGQDRAMQAIELGLGVHDRGYNIFVCGLTGYGKMTTVQVLLGQRTAAAPTPPDYIYVHNFAVPDQPIAIQLPAGQGKRFAADMKQLVETLRRNIPLALKTHAFEAAKNRLLREHERRMAELLSELEQKASERGFLVRQVPPGKILFVPAIGGRAIESEEEFRALDAGTLQHIEQERQQLFAEVASIFERQRELESQLLVELNHLEAEFGEAQIAPRIAELKARYPSPEIASYLDAVQAHMVQHLDAFQESQEARPSLPLPLFELQPRFIEYQVNVVVDNSETRGAPVIVEPAPTYTHLFGTVERVVDRFGRLVTNFTMIRSGSILRANGGYLVFNLDDAIGEPLVWKGLKRFLRTRQIAPEPYDPLAIFSAAGIKPCPIPANTKLVVLGSPLLYELLSLYDEDFPRLFKVRADFGPDMPREESAELSYARFVARLTRDEGLLPFNRAGIAEVVRFGARRAEHQERLSARLSEVADLVREAAYWAARQGAAAVDGVHVEQALESKIYRSNRIEERIREMIDEGVLLIETAGAAVGQANGLAVLMVGDYAFGRPNRVTAAVGLGQAGIINIEREAKMSGRMHDKGVLILAGYLRHRFAQVRPLSLSASLCFEQSYGEVEGDSASSTELYALLSALSGIPLRQDIAVTGSVNQWGAIQAIGGVNEKVEGFYAVCKAKGLTGTQGVIIPEANVKHLVLRREVREAIAAGKFHIYPVRTVDQGLEILTGVRAGTPEEEGTVNFAVARRLEEFAKAMRAHARPTKGEDGGEGST